MSRYSELSQDELNDLLHGALYRRERYLNKPRQKGLNLKLDEIKELLQAGANLNSKDRSGVTAYQRALDLGYLDLLTLDVPNKKVAKKNSKK